jgi:hypothetical protein
MDGFQDNVWQMFYITGLETLFKIAADTLTAEKTVEEIQRRRVVEFTLYV